MKAVHKLFSLAICLVVLLGTGFIAQAQKAPTAKELAVQTLVDNQQYVFKATSVTPMSGRQRFLTSDYTVLVSKDTVISDLPYFGRAYAAPINTTDAGIKFTSLKFDYKITPKKKGGWDILIKPTDVREVQTFNLSVYKNGTAYLNVTSTNRQNISFNGTISERKKR